MKDHISCRKARLEIHNGLDRGDPLSVADSEDLTRFLPGEVQVHLERCPECRDFLHSLGTFAPMLRSQLDKALQDHSLLVPATVHQRQRGKTPQVPPVQEQRRGGTADAFKRFRNWLFGPAGKPAVVYRWLAVSALAVVLVSSLIAVRIYSVSTTHRAIEQQIDRVVELIYGEPLLPGIESALLRTQPTISDYVEDLDRTDDMWLEETDSQSYLN